jgi:hypothetical protein
MGMTVDIDIGGTRLDENIEDEDVVPVEDVEAVEVMDEEPLPPQRMPAAAKKPNPWVKRILVLVVAIVIIVVGLWAFVYFGTRITDISVNLSEDRSNFPDTIKVTALVGTSGSASIAGKGTLEVRYDEDLVYSSKMNINDAGTGALDVPYDSFIEGNGNYYFQVEYQGKDSPPALYEIDYIVESLNITAEVGTVGSSGQLNLTVFMQDRNEKNMGSDPRDAEIVINEIKNLDNNDEIQTSSTPDEVDDSFIDFEYSYFTSGNYSITATVTNENTKSSSDYYEVTQTTIWYLNFNPIARGIVTGTQPSGITYSASFDASASWNDGDITMYVWDFDNDNTVDLETTSPTASWSNYLATQDYDARLVVEGDEFIRIAGTDDEVEFGVTFIRVEAP